MPEDTANRPELRTAIDLDGLGRVISQYLADSSHMFGLAEVGTYGVLADVVHVTTVNGRRYVIDITAEE